MWSALAALGMIAFASQPASAYAILPPHSIVAGKTIADWTAAWWTWALQAPAAENPLTDTTGAFANLNNNGPVYFIAGTTGLSSPVTRSFQAPAGKPVLIPLINFFDTEPAEIDPPTATLDDRKNAADIVVAGWLNAVNPASLFASIDGSPAANLAQYLEVTGLFSMGPTQAGSLIASFGVPVGAELYPTKAAGYWLMIDGLAPGSHTLHFGGSSDAFTPDANCCTTSEIPAFSTDVTDNIFIPEPASALLILPGLIGLSALRLARRERAGG
jgi:hypothetical protein